MLNQDLSNYITQARKSGIKDEKIREGLLQSGWPSQDISEALTNTPPVSVTQSKPRAMMSKSLAIYFIIIAIAIAGYFAGAYYMTNYQSFPLWPFEYQPESSPTFTPRPAIINNSAEDLALSEVEGWQTYRNEEYGFEFKYPPTYYTQTASGAKITTVNASELNFEGDARASIEIVRSTDRASVKENIVKDYNEENITVGGKDAQLITGELDFNVFGWGGTNHGYVFIDNIPFRLEFDNSDQEIAKLFNQILSTFRFIE